MIFDPRKKHYKNKIRVVQMKIWDMEFLRYELRAVREGVRINHDQSKELLDGLKRRLAGEKYNFYYCASQDEVGYKDIPILPDDLEKLPDEPKDTKDFRFYKKKRENINEQVCQNLKSSIQKYSDQIEQFKKQLEGIDGQIEGQNGVNEKIEGLRNAIALLKEHIKKSS